MNEAKKIHWFLKTALRIIEQEIDRKLSDTI